MNSQYVARARYLFFWQKAYNLLLITKRSQELQAFEPNPGDYHYPK